MIQNIYDYPAVDKIKNEVKGKKNVWIGNIEIELEQMLLKKTFLLL